MTVATNWSNTTLTWTSNKQRNKRKTNKERTKNYKIVRRRWGFFPLWQWQPTDPAVQCWHHLLNKNKQSNKENCKEELNKQTETNNSLQYQPLEFCFYQSKGRDIVALTATGSIPSHISHIYFTFILQITLSIFAKFGSQYLSWFVQICQSFDLPLISTGFGELCPFYWKKSPLWLNFKCRFTPFLFFSGPPFSN